jgi:hypothetical protein
VLRPGRVAPRNMELANDFGDHWSITKFGFGWLAEASKRPFFDMGRMSEVLAGFVPRFGPGFGQSARSRQSAPTGRSTIFPPACTLAGAAAESILLAVTIAKSKDEAKMLKTYGSSGGRARITAYVVGQATSSVKRQFEAALHILQYWRDDASHGTLTSITEVEAYAAVSELLRLAQFTSDHWDDLTA